MGLLKPFRDHSLLFSRYDNSNSWLHSLFFAFRYLLEHCECYFGRWRSGDNAGGQISQDSHHTNPQLVFTVNKGMLKKVLKTTKKDQAYITA